VQIFHCIVVLYCIVAIYDTWRDDHMHGTVAIYIARQNDHMQRLLY